MEYLLDIDVLMGGFALGCLVLTLCIFLCGMDKDTYAKVFSRRRVGFTLIGIYSAAYLISLGLNYSMGEIEASPQSYIEYSKYKDAILQNEDSNFVKKHDVLSKIEEYERDKKIRNFELGKVQWFYVKIQGELNKKKRAEERRQLLAKSKQIKEGLADSNGVHQ